MSFLPKDRETYNQENSKGSVNLFTYIREDWQVCNRESTTAHEICVEDELMRVAQNDCGCLPQFHAPLKPSNMSFPACLFAGQVSVQDLNYWMFLSEKKGVYTK